MALATPDIDINVGQSNETARPYKVLLLNDPVNLMHYVVRVLRSAPFGFTEEKASQVMLEVHNDGRAVVAHADTLDGAMVYANALMAATLNTKVEKD